MRIKGSKIYAKTQICAKKRTYHEYTKLCDENHKVKWPLHNTEDLKPHEFCFVGIICITMLHEETFEDDWEAFRCNYGRFRMSKVG
jgi:hypothetical protein